MNKLFLIILASFIAFACFACDEDCNCPDEEVEEEPDIEIWEEMVRVTVSGTDVSDKKVYAKTCANVFVESGPKDPVIPGATSYEYIFMLDVNVLVGEEEDLPGEPICYRIHGEHDSNCTVTSSPSKLDLVWDGYVEMEVVYDCNYD